MKKSKEQEMVRESYDLILLWSETMVSRYKDSRKRTVRTDLGCPFHTHLDKALNTVRDGRSKLNGEEDSQG